VRPTGPESLRAIQAALAERLIPELTSLFAQEAGQAASMLIESLAASWDTEAEDLQTDNASLREILAGGRDALASLAGNTTAGPLVSYIDGVLGEEGDGRIAVSSLARENSRLLSALEKLLEFIEDTDGEEGCETLEPVRRAAYRQLRRAAVRGWAYFDVSAFRERIVRARAELS
jgi:hypothetical protein